MSCGCGALVQFRLTKTVLKIKSCLATNDLEHAKKLCQQIEDAIKPNCKKHKAQLIFALYQAGTGLVDARQKVRAMRFSDKPVAAQTTLVSAEPERDAAHITLDAATATAAAEIESILRDTLALTEAAKRGETITFNAKTGLYLLAKILQIASLPLGSLTGTQLSNIGEIFGKPLPGQPALASMGLVTLMTLFFAQEPPTSIPQYTKSPCVNLTLFLACVAGALLVALPSAQLTKTSAENTLEKFFPHSPITDHLPVYATLAQVSNLYLNTILGSGVFTNLITIACTLWESSKGERIKTGVVALIATGLCYLTYTMPYLQAGVEANIIKDIPSTPAKWLVSVLINIPDVMVVLIPACLSSMAAYDLDSTRHWLERAFALFSATCGTGLFAVLTHRAFAQWESIADYSPYAVIASCFYSWPSMYRFGYDTASYMRQMFTRMYNYYRISSASRSGYDVIA